MQELRALRGMSISEDQLKWVPEIGGALSLLEEKQSHRLNRDMTG